MSRTGRRAVVVHFDQQDPAAVESLFSETEAMLGTHFLLVNNAGVDATGVEVADMALEDWDRSIRTTSTARSTAATRSSARAGEPVAADGSSTSRPFTRSCHGPARQATTARRPRCATSRGRCASKSPATTSTSTTSRPAWC